jgi:hypothetical protein
MIIEWWGMVGPTDHRGGSVIVGFASGNIHGAPTQWRLTISI